MTIKSDESTLEKAAEILKNSVIKVKNTEQMFEYIQKVFESSKIDVSYAYFTFKNGELSFYRGDKSLDIEDIKKKINSFIHKKNIMGEIIPFETTDYIIVPIFEASDESEVLVLKSNDTIRSFINDQFSTVLKNIHIYRQLKLKCEELVNLTHIDEVTGLYNQRKLAKDLDSTIAKHLKNNQSFSLMFVDIDHFKNVNDNYGHIVGSDILSELGKQLKKLVRSTDDVYRFGGDEFIILLREVDIETVHQIGLRTLKAITSHNFTISTDDKYKMSVSIGIAEFPTDAQTSKEMIQLADSMMYESKKSGRGKVIHLGKEVSDVDVSSE